MEVVRIILGRHLFSVKWNFLPKPIFSSFPFPSHTKKKQKKKKRSECLSSKIELWVTSIKKRQVFSNWNLFKTIHQFKDLNHAEEKLLWFFPLSSNCFDMLLSLFPAYFILLCFSQSSTLFSLPIRNFWSIVFPHSLQRKLMSKQLIFLSNRILTFSPALRKSRFIYSSAVDNTVTLSK